MSASEWVSPHWLPPPSLHTTCRASSNPGVRSPAPVSHQARSAKHLCRGCHRGSPRNRRADRRAGNCLKPRTAARNRLPLRSARPSSVPEAVTTDRARASRRPQRRRGGAAAARRFSREPPFKRARPCPSSRRHKRRRRAGTASRTRGLPGFGGWRQPVSPVSPVSATRSHCRPRHRCRGRHARRHEPGGAHSAGDAGGSGPYHRPADPG